MCNSFSEVGFAALAAQTFYRQQERLRFAVKATLNIHDEPLCIIVKLNIRDAAAS